MLVSIEKQCRYFIHSTFSDRYQTSPAGSCAWLHRVAPSSMTCLQGSLVPNGEQASHETPRRP